MLEVHVLASGSDGTCTVIQSDDDAIVIDAGLSCKALLKQMDQEGVDPSSIRGIFLTHEHADHVSGAGPLARRLGVPVLTSMPTFSACSLGQVDFIPIDHRGPVSFGGFEVTPLPTCHDAVDPCCYFTKTDQGSVLLATDTGKTTFQIDDAISKADVLILESNYDPDMLANGPYPPALQNRIRGDHGHLSNFDCARAINRNVRDGRSVFLAHLSRKNNVPDLARDTVATVTGMHRLKVDCLEFFGDSRTLKVKGR
ncbi:MAG: MBL fold metallo-hydrolase [Candidatus Methanomethylophilaceae archaeon]|nr:MBL fold metallo-hydrolase [Candidatus Methanomethylophilaceae archaeon]